MNDERALLELCRRDFATFVQRAFCELFPDVTLTWNWHLDVMIADLLALMNGEQRRQLILVPPRSLKSLVCSVFWPAFLLGRQPGLKIIAVSYAQSLADDHARLCYDLMTSDWYKQVFKTRLVRGRQPIDNFRTTRRGHRIATSIGGTLTGRGADLIIIDDPLKAEDALSESMRSNVKTWFSNTLPSRTDNKATGKVLVVMQRLHQDDPAAMLMGRNWPALILPAIAPDDITFRYSTIFGPQEKRWRQGEPLQAEREPLDVLEELRLDMGAFAFSAQYLQDPEPLEGNIIKRPWLRRYAENAAHVYVSTVQSWDTANKPGTLNDFSVCTTWGVTADKQYHLLHVLREHLSQPDLIRAVIAQKKRFNADVVLVEDAVAGTGVVQALAEQGIAGIKAILPKGDKTMRLVAVSTLFENGRVLLPDWAPWLDDYVSEIVNFPGRYDDQVDSTSQALLWLQEFGVEPHYLTYIRQEKEAQHRRQHDLVKIQSPRRVWEHFSDIQGNGYATDNDGIVIVPRSVAAPLIYSAGWVDLDRGKSS